jgi:hypothetical protein
MSKPGKNTALPEDFQTVVDALPNILTTQITIVCSSSPEILFAGALLCKSILRAKKLFQVKYSNPIILFETFNEILEKYHNSTIVFIGIRVIGSGRLFSTKHPIIMLSGSIKSRSSKIHHLSFDEPTPVIAYYFAKAHFSVTNDELLLTSLGILAENDPPTSMSDKASSLIQSSIDNKLLVRTKGYRLFGHNTLSVYDSLFYNIRPYIPQLSGNEDGCENLLIQSGIPVSKRFLPFEKLNTDEAQAITQQIVSVTDPILIPKIFGLDFRILRESSDSALRFLSTFVALIKTSRVTQSIGESFAVMLGDRARALRNLIDAHMVHCRNVLTGLNLLKTRLESSDDFIEQLSEKIMLIPSLGITHDALSDVGIISISNNILDATMILLKSDEIIEIVVNNEQGMYLQLLQLFTEMKIPYITTSKNSLRLLEAHSIDQAALTKNLNNVLRDN